MEAISTDFSVLLKTRTALVTVLNSFENTGGILFSG